MFRASPLARAATVEANSKAGRSYARKVTGSIPRWNIWRALMKANTIQHPGLVWSLWGTRWWRWRFKSFMQIWTFFFPWLLYHKYILPEFKYHHYTNGDERWKLNPATIMYDISARAPATADFAFGNNPWKTFAPSFNQIPWHEWTRNDNPDIERGWSQFGTNYPGPLHSWKENIDGVHSLRNYQESRGSWASNAFMDLTMWQMFCFGVESLNNDLKYQYWDVWRDPVEDRNEGLGWMRLWRRTRNESGGTGGIYLIDPLQGGHLGREYWSFH